MGILHIPEHPPEKVGCGSENKKEDQKHVHNTILVAWIGNIRNDAVKIK
jgi:hypothetical protein